MSFAKLDDHIWIHVLDFLTPTLPKPLSGLTKQEAFEESDHVRARLPNAGSEGVTSRRAIKAPELAALMSVSVAFNKLASVPLYKTIICDNFGSLLNWRDGPPAHPQIRSKAQLFRLTTALHLEYGQKGTAGPMGAFEPSYEEIHMDPYMWKILGRTEREMSVYQALREMEYIFRNAFTHPLRRSPEIPFPALKRLTVGAVFGGQNRIWEELSVQEVDFSHLFPDWVGRGSAVLRECHEAMVDLFCNSPIVDFCQRGYAGPLSLPRITHWVDKASSALSKRTSSPLFAFHFSPDDGSTRLPIVIGHRNRWQMERVIHMRRFPPMAEIVTSSLHYLETHRDALWAAIDPAHNPYNIKPDDASVQLSIYGNTTACPPPSTVTVPDGDLDERQYLAAVSQGLYEDRRKARSLRPGQADDRKWHPLALCQPCLACGWTYEQGVEPEDELGPRQQIERGWAASLGGVLTVGSSVGE